MNSRRLEAIRANGNKIVGAAANDLDAGSAYKKGQDPRASEMGGTFSGNDAAMDMREHEIAMNNNLHLVPSRWERSGWRYVQKDPGETNFFRNPNRVNNFGVNAEKKRFASSNRESFYKSANKSAFGNTNGREQETSYGRFFQQQR